MASNRTGLPHGIGRVTHVNRTDDLNVAMDMALTPVFRFLPEKALAECTASDITDMVWAYRAGADGAAGAAAAGVGGAEWDRAALEARVGKVLAARRTLAELKDIPYIPQRSQEWYDMRKQRLTASSIAQALGQGKYGTRAELVSNKVREGLGLPTPFKGNVATQWGIMFEAMASRTYSQQRGGVALYEFGMLPHPEVSCFGASPDNISEMGVMVEYKCPYKRAITGEIPKEYQYQMQGQMAVCNMEECDYVECGLEKLPNIETYYEVMAGQRRNHGVILEWIGPGGALSYDYSPEELLPAECVSWGRAFGNEKLRGPEGSDAGLSLKAMVFWRLKTLHIVRVYFQPDVWGALLPQIRQFWDDVVAGRAEAIATGSLNGEIAAKAAADAGAAEAAANGGGAEAKKKAGGSGGGAGGAKRFAFLADSDID
jgi:putative phage-type endonuclease